MPPTTQEDNQPVRNVQPLCPAFGECLGCCYQNIAYDDELAIKEKGLKDLLKEALSLSDDRFAPMVASPKPYHYRNRLDLKLKRTKENGIFIGFTPVEKKGVLPVEACYIAEESISAFIPELKKEAIAKLPAKYRLANLTVRTGDDGRVHWGGIGKRSCQLLPKDYFWTDLEGRRLFYSLDTFFQANLSILPGLFAALKQFPVWGSEAVFYDLYGGVGLFSIVLADHVKRSVLIEENPASLQVAHHNKAYNKIDNIDIIEGKVEDQLPRLLGGNEPSLAVAMIDPPRAGLSEKACKFVADRHEFGHILYLSCNPETLAHDLKQLCAQQWEVVQVTPFDFFPKTKHLETLVLLKSSKKY